MGSSVDTSAVCGSVCVEVTDVAVWLFVGSLLFVASIVDRGYDVMLDNLSVAVVDTCVSSSVDITTDLSSVDTEGVVDIFSVAVCGVV